MDNEIKMVLDQAGAIYEHQHVVYASGRHGSGYINMDACFPDVDLMQGICQSLGEQWENAGVETIAAPATGGIVISVLTTFHLTRLGFQLSIDHESVAGIWADKKEDGFVFRDAFRHYLGGKRVLVVEDVLTTGSSVCHVINAARDLGAEVIGASAIVNRGGVTAQQLGVPRLESLVEIEMDSFDPESCPLCANETPIVENLGHGAEYRKQHPDYPGGYVP